MSESIKLDLEHDRMKSLWLSQRDVMELCMGKQELSITILRLWLTYLNRLSINVGKNDLYGFIDPCFIQSQHDPTNAEAYIQNKLSDDKKECYLAPYHNKQNNVVFLCSLERKPDKNIIHIVDSALDGYHKLQGVQKKKPTWIYPICQRQPESYESGYYIMIHTLNIVSAGIINLWMQIFGNPEPFQEDELVNVQQRCASLILDFIQGI
ncbi:TNP1 [Trifolium pratense]|uniref:TNP1 n=1 Tax=Trifolium pratense TaxID=57577 RepID=A0A2K3JKP2_TRIPR|nr:TNP1 [Trifolium pratense]